MSRSRRKHPFIGNTTAESEKQDKGIQHQRARSRERDILRFITKDPDGEYIFPDENELGNE